MPSDGFLPYQSQGLALVIAWGNIIFNVSCEKIDDFCPKVNLKFFELNKKRVRAFQLCG